MHHEARLEYTEALLRSAAFAFWRRTVGVRFVIALALLSCFLGFLVWRGDRSWFVGAFGAVLFLGFILVLLVYFVHLRNALGKFRAMGSPIATLSLEDASFTMSSGLGSTTLRWSAVAEVWRYPSFWLLLFSNAQFTTVPIASVPPEAQAFILSRVSAAGGKIAA